MAQPFFTIGHSTRSISQFVDLLRASQVVLAVDVRRIPRSRINPQFNRETLPDALTKVQIGYVHLASLGGLRKGAAQSPHIAQLSLGELEFSQLRRLRLDERFC